MQKLTQNRYSINVQPCGRREKLILNLEPQPPQYVVDALNDVLGHSPTETEVVPTNSGLIIVYYFDRVRIERKRPLILQVFHRTGWRYHPEVFGTPEDAEECWECDIRNGL